MNVWGTTSGQEVLVTRANGTIESAEETGKDRDSKIETRGERTRKEEVLLVEMSRMA